MVNCFEARNGFAALWRKTLEPQARGLLLDHLKQCARCDRAFRAFALTGALLYSDPAIAEDRPRESAPFALSPGARHARRGWRAVCAMAAMICAAGIAAYLAAAVPGQTLDDALSNPEPSSELIGQEELPAPLNDLAS